MNHRYSSCKPPNSNPADAEAASNESSGEVGIQDSASLMASLASGDMNKMPAEVANATENSMLMVVDHPEHPHHMEVEDSEKPAHVSHHLGGEGNHLGTEGHRFGTEGHRFGTDGHRLGTEGHRLGTEDHRLGTEGHQKDTEGHQKGTEGHPFSGEGHHGRYHIHNLAGLVMNHSMNHSINSEAFFSKSPSPPALETALPASPAAPTTAASESTEAIQAASRIN